MSKDNEAKTDCSAETLDPEPCGHGSKDESNKSKQFPFQHLSTFPLPKNWSNIERLKNQRNKIQEKLLQQSLPTLLCSEKEVISGKDNVICDVEVKPVKPFEDENKHIVSSDEDCSSDSEGHLVIDYESKDTDIPCNVASEIHVHIHRSKSDENATNYAVSNTKNDIKSKSMSDCTSTHQDKDLCELKVANINDSFFMAISGTEIVTNTLEDGKPIKPTIYPHAKPQKFSFGTNYEIAENSNKGSVGEHSSEDFKDSSGNGELNISLKEDQSKMEHMTQTKAESLKLVVPKCNKYSSKTTKKKLKSYLLANKKKTRKKFFNSEERRSSVEVTCPKESKKYEEKNDLRHPNPEVIVLENEYRFPVQNKNENLSDESRVFATKKRKIINDKTIPIKDKLCSDDEHLPKQELQNETTGTLAQNFCKNYQNSTQEESHSKESPKSLYKDLNRKDAARIEKNKCNLEHTMTRDVSSNVIAEQSGPESSVKDFKKNSTSVSLDDGLQPRVPLSSTTPVFADSRKITSQLSHVIVTTCANPIKANNMRSLLAVDKQSQPKTDHISGKNINDCPITDCSKKTDKPVRAMVYINPPQYTKSPSILIPVKSMAMQTTLGHPFALSSLPTKTMPQIHQDQSSHQRELGKPVLLVVDKVNHILPQSSSRFLVLNPVTSTQPSPKQITGMPNVLSSGQIFLTPIKKGDTSGKGLEGPQKGVLQPMHNLPILQVVPSPISARTTKSPQTSSIPTNKLQSSAYYRSPGRSVYSTPRKPSITNEKASQGSGNKLDRIGERQDVKQASETKSHKGSLQKTTFCKEQTHKSKNRPKYLKHFKEIATWNKYDENENIVDETISDESFDHEQSVCTPQICSTQSRKSNSELHEKLDYENSPISPSVCPSSQNSIMSVGSDSDQSFDSVDLDRYRRLKSAESRIKHREKDQTINIDIAECSHYQYSESLNESIEQTHDTNELITIEVNSKSNQSKEPLTDHKNTELRDQSFRQTENLYKKCCINESQSYDLIDKTKRHYIQLDKSSQEHANQLNEKDQHITLKDGDKIFDKTHNSKESSEDRQTFEQANISSVQNHEVLNGDKNSKLRQKNGKTLEQIKNLRKIDESLLIEDRNTEVTGSYENVQTPMQTNPASPVQTDPISPETSDKLSTDSSGVRQEDMEQKKFLRTKFIILKGDICKKWLEVKKKAGFGNVPDPDFVHYLLDMVKKEQELDSDVQHTLEAPHTSENIQDDQTSKRSSKKRPAEKDNYEESLERQNKRPKLQSPSRRQINTTNGHSFLSKSVKKQINWAVNVFTEWLKSLGDSEIDFEYQSTAWLNLMLERFYREARTIDNTLYTRENLQNLRRCLSVYLDGFPESNSVAISIQLDPGFYTSNQVLTDLVKTRLDIPPDENTSYISQEDFVKMYSNNTLSDNSPLSLLWKVWFDVCFHLCNKHFPQNFLKSLKKHHICLQSDINGVYYTFTDSDDLSLPSEESYGRMYATPDCPNRCPVRSTTVYLSKLCNSCDAFFQCPNTNLRVSQLWYRPIPLTLTKLNSIMQNISAKAKLSRIYTTSDVFATWSKYKSLKTEDKERNAQSN